jgi:acyl-homoserine lactone acylase PvdQ
MRILKKTVLLILVLVLLTITGSSVYSNSLKPDYSGDLKLATTENKTDLYFDKFGIPHIYEENQLDAMATLSYLDAQVRLCERGYDYNDSGLYKVNTGSSIRRIIDFSYIENSISILPTGPSGNPFSKHYKDQSEMNTNGEFRKIKLNKDEIINSSTKLTILPNHE